MSSISRFKWMNTILTHISDRSPEQVVTDLFDHQLRWIWLVISFLYFANLMKFNLSREESGYRTALSASDYVLPDGIALQKFYDREMTTWKKLHNCNGTDLIPAYLDKVYESWAIPWVWLLTVYDESIWKYKDDEEDIQHKRSERFWTMLSYFEHVHYKERNQEWSYDLEALIKSAVDTHSPHKILILCTWTPHQEIRAHTHSKQLKDAGLLVFCAWGLIDYIVWVEKRAPNWVVKARVLETFWRVVTKPKKNLKKFLVMFKIMWYWRKKYVRGVETI